MQPRGALPLGVLVVIVALSRRLRIVALSRAAPLHQHKLVEVEELVAVDVGLLEHVLELALVVRRRQQPADEQHQPAELAKHQDAVVVGVDAREEERELLEFRLVHLVEHVTVGAADPVDDQVEVAPQLQVAVGEHVLRERAEDAAAAPLAMELGVAHGGALGVALVLLLEEPLVRLQLQQLTPRVAPHSAALELAPTLRRLDDAHDGATLRLLLRRLAALAARDGRRLHPLPARQLRLASGRRGGGGGGGCGVGGGWRRGGRGRGRGRGRGVALGGGGDQRVDLPIHRLLLLPLLFVTLLLHRLELRRQRGARELEHAQPLLPQLRRALRLQRVEPAQLHRRLLLQSVDLSLHRLPVAVRALGGAIEQRAARRRRARSVDAHAARRRHSRAARAHPHQRVALLGQLGPRLLQRQLGRLEVAVQLRRRRRLRGPRGH